MLINEANLEVYSFAWVFIYIHVLCVRVAKAQASLRIYAQTRLSRRCSHIR